MNKNNYKFYIVGGFPRDIILGSSTIDGDYDVCGDCLPENLLKIVENKHRIKIGTSNFPLGTIKLIIDEKLDVEYTCFRKESYRGDGYHTPNKVVFTNDAYTDALRRDFTVNSLYFDPVTCEITDFFNGQKDIDNKVIKTVRESKEVFTEDALRILRMCRFSAKLGFSIYVDTINGAIDCAHLLNNISKERIGIELDKILCSTKYLDYGIDAIYNSKANHIICKSVMKDTAKQVCSSPCNRYIRWAVFLSDNLPKDARNFILDLSLGKDLANEVERLLSNREVYNYNKDAIIIRFAKMGRKLAKRLIEFIDIVHFNKSLQLHKIYNNMIKHNQFISYNMLQINGTDIMSLLTVKGRQVKHYKDKAYEYAVLNPDKNNLKDLKDYLIGIS